MTRIVNRVPLLRKPSRRHHHYRTNNGLLWALACGYNPDAWHIPDDPFDASTWITEEAQK